MKKLVLAGCTLLCSVTMAGAQGASDKDVAAWGAMMFTPVGALPIIEPVFSGPTASQTQLSLRGSTSKVDATGAPRTNTFGASLFFPGNARVHYGVSAAWLHSGGDGFGSPVNAELIGGDISTTAWEQAATTQSPIGFALDLKGNVGYAHINGSDGGSALSAVAQVPLKLAYQTASKATVSGFVAPGFGWGRVSDSSGGSENGTRPMLSLGAGWTSMNGVGVHLGTQQIFLDTGGGGDPPWIWSLGLTMPLGGKK